MYKRSRLAIVAGVATILALAACTTTEGEAADFPRKRIEVVVPWGAGGGSDQITRQLTRAAEDTCGWNISVTNDEGGGGSVGAATIRDAPADGYTIGSVDSSILYYVPSDTANISPDDFLPVMRFNERPTTIGVSTRSEYTSVDGLVDAAKSGKTIRIGVNSLGGVHHVSALGMAEAAGITFKYVTYPQGAAQAIQGILAGEAEGLIADDAEILPFVESGEIEPLVLMTEERGTVFPDVPTLKEAGIDWTNPQWRGLVLPLDTPQDVRDAIQECFMKAAEAESFLNFMERNGYAPRNDDSNAFAEIIENDYAKAKEFSELIG